MIPHSILDDCKRQTFLSLDVEETDASDSLKTFSDTTFCRNLDDRFHSFYCHINLHCYRFLSFKFRIKTLYLCSHDYDLF